MKSDWPPRKLGDLCEIVADKPDKFIGSKKYYTTGGINNSGDYTYELVDYKTRPGRADLMPEVGDVGFAKMKNTNKVFRVDENLKGSIFSTGFSFLRAKADILSEYLFIFVASHKFQKIKDDLAGDGIMGGIKKSDITKIELSLPPVETQKKIIKIVNAVFERVTKAKESTEKNLQNARELFESYLQSVFANSGDGWEESKFGEIIELLTDYHANGSYQVLKANVELKEFEDYAWMVRSTDFENNFENGKRYITKKAYNFLSKSKIFGDEIIISKIGNVGKVYLMPKIDRPCSLAMNLFLIRLNEKKCLSKYVYRYLNSKNGQEQIKSRVLGTTTKTITKDNVRSIKIPFPTLNMQQRIVLKLDELSAEAKKLEAIYQQKLADLEELEKIILHKTFNGELAGACS